MADYSNCSDLSLTNHVDVVVGESIAHVRYADCGPRDGPVVLALHGAPGGIQDFMELFAPLMSAEMRFIVPEFPGNGQTTISNMKFFDESTEARADLIVRFLKQLSIPRVATVVGHSMGFATALSLAANYDYFDSVVNLSGIGINPHRSLRPYWLTSLFAGFLQNSWTEPVANWLLHYAYTSRGFRLDSLETKAGLKSGIVSASKIGFEQVRTNALVVREKKLPILMAFCENDKLVEEGIPLGLARHIGIPEKNFTWFDSTENVVKDNPPGADADEYPRLLIFKRGGHFVHRSHQSIISCYIINLVRRVQATIERGV